VTNEKIKTRSNRKQIASSPVNRQTLRWQERRTKWYQVRNWLTYFLQPVQQKSVTREAQSITWQVGCLCSRSSLRIPNCVNNVQRLFQTFQGFQLLHTGTVELINSMEQSPTWQPDSPSTGQKIPRLLCNPKFHCRVYEKKFFGTLSWTTWIHSTPA